MRRQLTLQQDKGGKSLGSESDLGVLPEREVVWPLFAHLYNDKSGLRTAKSLLRAQV